MAPFWEGEEESSGIWMGDMLCAVSLFPWFAFLSPLISLQTLIRLQLPGSVSSTSILHSVQLQSTKHSTHKNTQHRHEHGCFMSRLCTFFCRGLACLKIFSQDLEYIIAKKQHWSSDDIRQMTGISNCPARLGKTSDLWAVYDPQTSLHKQKK